MAGQYGYKTIHEWCPNLRNAPNDSPHHDTPTEGTTLIGKGRKLTSVERSTWPGLVALWLSTVQATPTTGNTPPYPTIHELNDGDWWVHTKSHLRNEELVDSMLVPRAASRVSYHCTTRFQFGKSRVERHFLVRILAFLRIRVPPCEGWADERVYRLAIVENYRMSDTNTNNANKIKWIGDANMGRFIPCKTNSFFQKEAIDVDSLD